MGPECSFERSGMEVEASSTSFSFYSSSLQTNSVKVSGGVTGSSSGREDKALMLPRKAFSCPKEGFGQKKDHFGSVSLKQVHPSSFIQDDDLILGGKVSPKGILHSFNRSEGCLLAYL